MFGEELIIVVNIFLIYLNHMWHVLCMCYTHKMYGEKLFVFPVHTCNINAMFHYVTFILHFPLSLCNCRGVHNVLSEKSPVPVSALRPVQPLHWNITPRVAEDIQTAMTNMDK